EAALEPGAPVIHEGPRLLGMQRPDLVARQPGFEDTNVVHLFTQRRGDIEAGFAEADVVIENTFSCPPVQHASLEQHVGAAWHDGTHLTVWSSSQASHWQPAPL